MNDKDSRENLLRISCKFILQANAIKIIGLTNLSIVFW